MKILAIICIALIVHLFINLARMLSAKHYYKMFKAYHADYNRRYGNANKKIMTYADSINGLFNKAGTNHVTSLRIDHKQLPALVADCVCDVRSQNEVENAFLKTIGIYRTRCINTINPLYWLALPMRIIEALHFKTSRATNIILSLLSWLLSVVAAYFVEKLLDSQLMHSFADKICNMIK